MDKTILIATEKPFDKKAISRIKRIIENSPEFNLKLLQRYTEHSDLIRAVKDVHALVVRSDKVTKSVIDAAHKLSVIVRAGSGFDNIDLDAASGRGMVVMNTPGQNANAVAELAFGLMLGLIRNKYNGTPGTELKEKSIGMHGFGNIGKNMSRIAMGFGMKVHAFDPYIDQEIIKAYGVNVCENVEELYRECNFISINIPINDETLKFIDYNLLYKTKKGTLLVNTARKELINENDLLRIMEERPGFLYASDVAPNCQDVIKGKFKDRVLFTVKKMGAQTAEANINAGVAAVNQIIGYFKEGDATFQVN